MNHKGIDTSVDVEPTQKEPPPTPTLTLTPATTPLPYKKVFIGAMIWFIDWFNGGALATYVGFMVLDFGVARTKADVGYYSGFISSTYYFTQFLSSFWWGKISDKVGRRPILLCGLLGALISTVAFGFSSSFAFAIVARSLNGLLNGNTGIVKTYIGEITDSTNQARAFGYLSLFGGLGMVAGPMVGGYCSLPAQKYPSLFPPGSFFDKFPYLLPNLVSAAINILLLVLAFVYLTETRKVKYIGLSQESETGKGDIGDTGDKEMEEFSGSGERESVETAVLISGNHEDVASIEEEELVNEGEQKTGIRKWVADRIAKLGMLKDPNVLLSVGLYAFYGFTAATFGEALPLLALLPITLGGMGFSTNEIGNISTIAGATIILFNLLFYHRIANKLGLVMTFRIGTAALVVLHVIVAELPRWTLSRDAEEENIFIVPHFGFWMAAIVVFSLFWCCRQMQLTSLMQLISNSVTPADMGSVNGLAQSIVALTRMFAPAFGSTILAWSVSVNKYYFFTSRFIFFILGLLSLAMTLVTTKLNISLNKPKLWAG